jgi:hypothetical protein
LPAQSELKDDGAQDEGDEGNRPIALLHILEEVHVLLLASGAILRLWGTGAIPSSEVLYV